VNVSKAVIQREDLVKRYCDVVRKTHANPRYLEFELTESLAYDDYDKIQSILDVIHSYGSTCSMDDFGKSYSNLNALGMLNFDTVKMDKCFFDNGFPADMKKQQMVEGTLNLLKGLRLEVVAEGIEDADQAAELKRLGCDMIQGFYYAKPMPVSEFEMFMRASSNMNTTV
jgi:EAL domain-containing protein (putative c-di-GMP-specific phosphodiesterase class I)